jgi:hypothetical protein
MTQARKPSWAVADPPHHDTTAKAAWARDEIPVRARELGLQVASRDPQCSASAGRPRWAPYPTSFPKPKAHGGPPGPDGDTDLRVCSL